MQHEELHVPELEGAVSYPGLLLWFSKPPLPQSGHLDTAVILDFHILDFLPSVDM